MDMCNEKMMQYPWKNLSKNYSNSLDTKVNDLSTMGGG